MKKLFFEVRDVGAAARDLERSLFVPTFLQAHLGDTLELVLRLPRARAVTVLVRVVGRRLRPGAHLVAGLFVATGPGHPVLALLHDYASGRLVDFEARLREQQRHPARVCFRSREEAQSELLGLLGDHGALLRVGAVFGKGDKLALEVVVAGGDGFVVDAVVQRPHIHDEVSGVVAVVRDPTSRLVLGAFINDEDQPPARQARSM